MIFTDQQLEALYQTGASVVISRPSGPQLPVVAWQTFRPFSNNLIEWQPSYGVYFSAGPFTAGGRIIVNGSEPTAIAGRWYTVTPAGYLQPGNSAPVGSFYLRNQYDTVITGGLTQTAAINGQTTAPNCICAAPMLTRGALIIPSPTAICIWLQTDISPNTILGQPVSPITQLNGDDLAVAYNTGTGQFDPV